MEKEVDTRKWVENHGDYLFSLARYKLNDAELARDLVQETFLAAIKGIVFFRGDSSEKTWLVRILNNKIIDHFRAGKKEMPGQRRRHQPIRTQKDPGWFPIIGSFFTGRNCSSEPVSPKFGRYETH
jgi:RNA polymerase sigma factor (sigma-70 family)